MLFDALVACCLTVGIISVRLEVRKGQQLKRDGEPIGNMCKVKVKRLSIALKSEHHDPPQHLCFTCMWRSVPLGTMSIASRSIGLPKSCALW